MLRPDLQSATKCVSSPPEGCLLRPNKHLCCALTCRMLPASLHCCPFPSQRSGAPIPAWRSLWAWQGGLQGPLTLVGALHSHKWHSDHRHLDLKA